MTRLYMGTLVYNINLDIPCTIYLLLPLSSRVDYAMRLLSTNNASKLWLAAGMLVSA